MKIASSKSQLNILPHIRPPTGGRSQFKSSQHIIELPPDNRSSLLFGAKNLALRGVKVLMLRNSYRRPI